jgi:hypothetical protein
VKVLRGRKVVARGSARVRGGRARVAIAGLRRGRYQVVITAGDARTTTKLVIP